ncbi:MAG: phosphodiester glycosidase family protein [Kofleriaceae bacterium]|nr:phosphodiester glycosidase family protein [Kofleriaceae bacterium]MBP6837961.1 phosphodiester glycosidase family protein [Kofleriaceae bacterium]
MRSLVDPRRPRRRRGALLLAALGLAAPSSARAEDSWVDPYPGMRLLHRVTAEQNLWLATIDLCAPGIHVRATGADERGQTVSSFGAGVSAQLAVNGDFFDGNHDTDGPSLHAGVAWSGVDHGYVAPLAFGDHQVALPHHDDTSGAPAWAHEVVSGHPSLLAAGVEVPSGDPLCTTRHPRTAAGLDAARRTLFLLVADGRAAGRAGLRCDETVALLREVGATDAVNLDGGGSSTMWTPWPGVLNRPSDGRERVVGNHLAVYAGGADEPGHCPNRWPSGWLDVASCEVIAGWAQDRDVADAPIAVHLYFGGPAGSGAPAMAVTADQHRDDLCTAIGSCGHGFSTAVPLGLRDGQPHEVFAYGIDHAGGHNPALARGGSTVLVCAPLPPPADPSQAVRRWVSDGAVLAAWGWQGLDVGLVDDAVVAGYADGAAWPAAPRLLRVEGSAELVVDDGGALRAVDEVTARRWRLDPASAASLSAAAAALAPRGPPWPAQAFVFRGAGPAVYVLDGVLPAPGPGPGPGAPGGGGGGDDDGDGTSAGCQVGASGGALALLVPLLTRRRRRPSPP